MIRRVVLLHGLWMPAASMRWMGARLREAGYDPETFGYRTVRGGPEAAMPRLAGCLRAAPAHVVAHSLGGLVALATVDRMPGVPVGRVVCLGSPLRGSGTADTLAHHAWGAFALGHSARLLREGCAPCARGLEVGVVAGVRSFGLGRLVAGFDGANDGAVAVAETTVDGLADHVVVRSSHSGLLFSRAAAAQAVSFLHAGRFDHATR